MIFVGQIDDSAGILCYTYEKHVQNGYQEQKGHFQQNGSIVVGTSAMLAWRNQFSGRDFYLVLHA